MIPQSRRDVRPALVWLSSRLAGRGCDGLAAFAIAKISRCRPHSIVRPALKACAPGASAVNEAAMPVFHECQRSTACCRWSGQVRLADGEISRIARHLELLEHGFIQTLSRTTDDRRGLALQDKLNGECVFLEGSYCRLQPVKAQLCWDFSNLGNFPGFEAHCRAIPRDVSAEEWRALVSQATGRFDPRLPVNATKSSRLAP